MEKEEILRKKKKALVERRKLTEKEEILQRKKKARRDREKKSRIRRKLIFLRENYGPPYPITKISNNWIILIIPYQSSRVSANIISFLFFGTPSCLTYILCIYLAQDNF